MKLSKDCLIEKICSKDATRVALNSPYLDITEGKANLIGTNGRAIVVIPVEVSSADTQGHIPIDGLKAARKETKGKGGEIDAKANGAFLLNNGQSFPRSVDATFPNWRQVIPADKPFVFEIGLSASYLLDIVQALGGDGNVRLSFTGPQDPIIIRAMDGPLKYETGAKAVLMPVRIS